MAQNAANLAKPEAGLVRHGDREIVFTVRRSARRRRTIEIALQGGGVVVSSPIGVPMAEIAAFVVRRAPWILARIDSAQLVPTVPLDHGSVLPYLGGELAVEVVSAGVRHAKTRLEGRQLVVTTPEALTAEERATAIRESVIRWLRTESVRLATETVKRWKRSVGAEPRAVLVRDQRKRWGSCSVDGTLRFNWRIAMLDAALVDYIAVHELCHLRHPDHSPAFWAAVTAVLPEAPALRKRLRSITLPM